MAAFVGILLALFSLTAFAQADYAREQRWADEITPAILVGDPVQLAIPGGRKFLGIYAPNSKAQTGVVVVHGADQAIEAAADASEVIVIGGAELFRVFLRRAGRIHLTRVHGNIDGDVMWPAPDNRQWEVIEREAHDADERHAHAMTFEVWEKRT
jgi:hypothetical protein